MLIWILFLSLLIKLPFLMTPFMGNFASYQASVAMMASRMASGHWVPLVLPELFMIHGGHVAWHLTYYPFCALVAAIPFKFLGGSLDFWGRLQAALSMLGVGYLVFKMTLQRFNKNAALWAAAVVSFSPMILLSGISFQNEAIALFMLCLSFYLCDKKPFLAGLIFSCTLLARIHFLFVSPAFLFFYLLTERKKSHLISFIFGCLLPAGLWFYATHKATQLRPNYVVTSLFDQAGESRILQASILSQGAFYLELAKTLLFRVTPIVIVPFILASLKNTSKQTLPFVAWGAGALLTLLLLPQKVMDHNFYLIALVPPAAILAGLKLENWAQKASKKALWVLGIVSILLVLRLYVPTATTAITDDTQDIRRLGHLLEEWTEPEDRVIAEFATLPNLLYYADRYGWTFDLKMAEHPLNAKQPRYQKMIAQGYGDPITWLEKLRGEGATHLAISSIETFKTEEEFYHYVTKTYAVIHDLEDELILFDLRKKKA